MSALEEIRDARLKKIALLKERGINPYPATTNREISLIEAIDNFPKLEETKENKWITGRIMSIRGQGAIIFVTLFDGTANFQVLFKKDGIVDAQKFELFKEVIDIGDFIETTGFFFTTQRGEKTQEVNDWNILSKSLLPLPEKWHGLQDEDERFRKRYLDMLMNAELRDIFVKKAKFWEVTRNFLKNEGFLEVETPTLEITTGGAEARPFKTHHNDFDIDVYMRICVGELWQKRLMSAGFEKTFEIGRVYRNEGSSPEHLQEFTNMEFYASYMNIEDGKKMVQKLYREIGEKVFGTTKFTTHGFTFDLADEWGEIDYADEIKKHTNIDIFESSEKEMKEKLIELGVKFDGENKERLTDSLWKYCRKQIAGPAFLINHPKIVAPLSKELESDNKKTDMFQVIIAGTEMGRAHAELNDPIDQANRLSHQQELIKEGDAEAMMEDKDFLEMMEYGMPPVFGFGFGERLFAFMIDKNIRETQMFPLMRPKNE